MRRTTSILLLAAVMLSAALLAGDEARSTGGDPPAPAPSTAPGESGVLPVAPAGAAGMTVYKDPDTGRLMPVPPAELRELLSEDLRQATSTSHEGLVQTAAPGGGVMIDLQGRFQNAMWASVADGKVTAHCDQDAATAETTASEPRKE